MGHTKGPWTADCNQFYPMGLTAHIIRNACDGDNGVSSLMLVSLGDVVYSDSQLCETPGAKSLSIEDANLIAASPDLLAACKAALIEIEAAWQAEGVCFGPDRDIDKKIKAAVARAEGTK